MKEGDFVTRSDNYHPGDPNHYGEYVRLKDVRIVTGVARHMYDEHKVLQFTLYLGHRYAISYLGKHLELASGKHVITMTGVLVEDADGYMGLADVSARIQADGQPRAIFEAKSVAIGYLEGMMITNLDTEEIIIPFK